MSLFFHDTVTRLRPAAATNRAGESLPAYAGLELALATGEDPDARALLWENVQVRPFSQGEVDGDDRRTAVSEWMIGTDMFAPDFDVKAGDWIRLADSAPDVPDGIVCTVVGDPARPTDPVGGSLDHIEIRVKRAAG